ncbi:MAG: 30S ribosome-binding factor RbfA [Anaerolineae bacterium]
MATTRRQKRLGELLKEELGTLLLREVRDPRLAGVTVTSVEISPDLGHARVYISLIGDQTEKTDALNALNHAGGFLRRQIAHRLDLRHVPRFTFHFDEAIERGQHILDILHQIEGESEGQET